MTLLFDRPVQGPGTHAFIVGVGRYPHAKPGKGVQANLRRVPDLPSAADSAKLMCDWLLANKDRLTVPLATLEVLISDPPSQGSRYEWKGPPVGEASATNVRAAGQAWLKRLNDPDSVAFFYCCGHGASHLQEPVLFLEDLNQAEDDIWTHVNVGLLAYALKKKTTISSAFMFSDACGEFIRDFELERNAQDCRFFNISPLGATHNRVSLQCAAAEAQLAYEGTDKEGSDLKFGRFTQVVLKGLNGSSARSSRNRWVVGCRDLLGDLKSLRRIFFSHWGEKEPFEPYPAVTPTDQVPIVFPDAFELPLIVITDPPDHMSHYEFFISQKNDRTSPWLQNRKAGSSSAWSTTVPPSRDFLYAIAVMGDDCHVVPFQPKEPLFDQWVPVS